MSATPEEGAELKRLLAMKEVTHPSMVATLARFNAAYQQQKAAKEAREKEESAAAKRAIALAELKAKRAAEKYKDK